MWYEIKKINRNTAHLLHTNSEEMISFPPPSSSDPAQWKLTWMVLLFSDSSSAVTSSAAFVSVDGSRHTIILAAAGRREQGEQTTPSQWRDNDSALCCCLWCSQGHAKGRVGAPYTDWSTSGWNTSFNRKKVFNSWLLWQETTRLSSRFNIHPL